MYPEILSIGSLVVHTYGLMVALGILAGVALAEHLHRKDGGEPGRVMDMALLVVLSGLAGARLLFVLVNMDYYAGHLAEIVMIWKGGLVFYGGLLGGVIGMLFAVRLYRLPLLRTLDAGAAALAMGHAFGRLGCFFAGCCHGCVTTSPLGVVFTNPRSLATSVLGQRVHPTQLYEFAFLLVLTGVLVWLHRRRRFAGQVAAVYLIAYAAFRFAVEFLRCDPRGSVTLFGATLSTGQIMSLAIIPPAIVWYWWLSRRPRPDIVQSPKSKVQS